VLAALSVVVRGNSPSAVRSMTPGVRAAARGISRTLDRTGTEPSVQRNALLFEGQRATYGSPPSVTDSGSSRASGRL
jgi:hypothetical protein